MVKAELDQVDELALTASLCLTMMPPQPSDFAFKPGFRHMRADRLDVARERVLTGLF